MEIVTLDIVEMSPDIGFRPRCIQYERDPMLFLRSQDTSSYQLSWRHENIKVPAWYQAQVKLRHFFLPKSPSHGLTRMYMSARYRSHMESWRRNDTGQTIISHRISSMIKLPIARHQLACTFMKPLST